MRVERTKEIETWALIEFQRLLSELQTGVIDLSTFAKDMGNLQHDLPEGVKYA